MDNKIIFLILVQVILGFCVYKTRKRGGWANLFISFFVILFLLLATEFVYRSFLRGKTTFSTVNLFFQFDSLMDFKFKDKCSLKAVEHFVVVYTLFNHT